MRWFRAQQSDVPPADNVAPTLAPAHGREPPAAPVDGRSVLLTEEGCLVSYIQHPSTRVSDALAATRTLRLRTEDGERQLERDEVLLVVPPPVASPPGLRVP
jgi:hypothetical protein